MPTTPQVVADLVERFAHNIDQYHRSEYSETQVHRESIDPFFMALGWDVESHEGVAPQHKKVIH